MRLDAPLKQERTVTEALTDRDLSAILDNTEILYAYKMSYILNFYREPSFRYIENTFGLQRTEIVMLIFLNSQDGISAQDMCDFSGHLKPNVSRAAISLEKRGLILRRRDRGDNRKQLLHLAPAGRTMYRKFMPLLVERERNMLGCLSELEREQFMFLLSKLASHVPNWGGKVL